LRFVDSGFAATDSLPLVETSRVNALSDVGRLFSGPVMAGTTFAEGEIVYRPFVSLTFGLEHALWGMNPVGYHLTNIVLHTLAALSVWLLGRQLGLSWWSSLAGAAVFALHPLVVATVPVIARRDSIIPVTAFTAAAACVVASDRRCKRALGLQLLGGALLVIALLSKESAFAALAMLPMLVAASRVGRGEPVFPALWAAIRASLPFLVVAAAAFAVRWLVLGGLGGGSDSSNLAFVDFDKYGQIVGAFTRDLLWPFAWIASSTREIWQRIAAAMLVGLAMSLPFLPRRPAMVAAAGVLWTVGFGLFCMVLKIGTIAWLAYFSLVGVALLSGGVLEGSIARLRAPWRGFRGADVLARAVSFVLLAGLAFLNVAFLRTSALVADYDQWRIAGEVTRRYTEALNACLTASPQARLATVRDLPSSLDDGRVETSLLGVTLLEDWTLDSALRIAFPDRRVDVHVASWGTVRGGADTLQFTCTRGTDTVELTTLYSPA
jgi:hypothetical protein